MSQAVPPDLPLASSLTADAFLGGALDVLQPAKGYRAGLDGVLLAAAVAAHTGQRVLDVGAGVGVVGLAVARRVHGARVTLVEREASLAALARQNIQRNALEERVDVVAADIVRPLSELGELAAAAGTFDHAAANPPYHAEGHGTASEDPAKAGAHAMPAGSLERWLRFMAAMVRPGGTATLVHRADALKEILTSLEGRFGEAVILPLHPREGEPASRVLVQAIKGSRAALQLRQGLVLHEPRHGFRPEVEAILRDGAALALR